MKKDSLRFQPEIEMPATLLQKNYKYKSDQLSHLRLFFKKEGG